MNLKNLIVTWLLSILCYLPPLFAVSQFQLGMDRTFDFIIIGGGTGGCAVARRLAESGKHKVLLIHEGGIPNDNLNIPGLADNFQNFRFANEMKYYYSKPQLNASLITGGVSLFPIGKATGGGSSINGLIWSRGNPLDYDNWANLLNDSSWNYKNMLPFFRKTENYKGDNPTSQRGFFGPITIEKAAGLKYGAAEFLEASEEIGYTPGDPNGPQTTGGNLDDQSKHRGRRVNSFSGYIGPLLSQDSDGISSFDIKKPNLIILLKTEAKRIIFKGNKAVGVTFINSNSSQPGYVKVKKEVILCAGTMDSPAILMRSGIGPKAVLNSAKIPVVKYVEGVGKNLHDHLAIPYNLIIGNRSASYNPARDLNEAAWEEYQTLGTGPYSLMLGQSAEGYFLSSLQMEKSWSDILVFAVFVDSVYFDLWVPDLQPNEVSVNWLVFTTRNKSRGTVTLDKTSIDKQPVIDFNFLEHPDDVTMMTDTFKLCHKLCKTEALQKIGCRVATNPLPVCSHLEIGSDSYLECIARQITESGYHAVGTCKMGRKDDPEAVLDSQLKVIGIQNLRVADASVMPVVTNANTQAAVYAIAERAADMILKQWNNNNQL